MIRDCHDVETSIAPGPGANRARLDRRRFVAARRRCRAGFPATAALDYRAVSVWDSRQAATTGPQFIRFQIPFGSWDNSSITDHEVRFGSKIVSKGRPQAVYNAHRIARAKKLGAALPHARRSTCDAVSIATKTLGRFAECRASISENLTRLGACCSTLSMGVQEARQLRRVSIGPSACLSLEPSVCRGRG